MVWVQQVRTVAVETAECPPHVPGEAQVDPMSMDSTSVVWTLQPVPWHLSLPLGHILLSSWWARGFRSVWASSSQASNLRRDELQWAWISAYVPSLCLSRARHWISRQARITELQWVKSSFLVEMAMLVGGRVDSSVAREGIFWVDNNHIFRMMQAMQETRNLALPDKQAGKGRNTPRGCGITQTP